MKLSTNNSVKYDEVNEKLAEVKNEISKVIVGQEDVIEQVLTCILCDGNILLESNPGMGKTKMASTISKTLGMDFSRIQSTPDLMPSDITGTHIVDESSGKAEFIFQQGPIFSNMVLVDEINRATPKTQSALLEAMQEKQVTVGNNSYSLEKPFFLIATQNPIEQEGSLHPDESVYMDGGLWKASDALQHAKSNGKVVHSGDDMTLYDAGSTTQTFDSQGKIKESSCMVYEKEYEGEIYSVKTKTGRRIEVSGNHPFLVNDGGDIKWVKAEELEENDYLVAPEKINVSGTDFPDHQKVIDSLAQQFTSIKREKLESVKTKLENNKELTRDDINGLRIAAGFSKKDLAEACEASYERVLNFLNGADNGLKQELADSLKQAEIESGDYFESFNVHCFQDSMSDSEAGFFIGFALAEGTVTDNSVSIWQKNLPEKFDKWVEIAQKIGLEPSIRTKDSTREAKIRSKPFIEYLKQRYSFENIEKLLDAPEEFRKSFLEIFILTESHYDAERNRITFTQQDEKTTNVIHHLLLQFGINSWIYNDGRVWRLKIQGKDIQNYLNKFEWRGEEPVQQSFDSAHRAVPLDSGVLEEIVSKLGVKYEGNMAGHDWYNSYTALRNRRDRMAEGYLDKFIQDMEQKLDKRQSTEVEKLVEQDPQKAAHLCGLSITEIESGIDATKYQIHKAYNGSEIEDQTSEYITQKYQERMRRVEKLLQNLKRYTQNDVFYDRIEKVEEEEYDGKVIGLSVPGSHNYLAGTGACGINHNTYPLPEAQRDRFMMKVKLDFPKEFEENKIVERFSTELDYNPQLKKVLSKDSLVDLQEFTREVPIADDILEDAVEIVRKTRDRDELDYGASPRASINLVLASKGHALIENRDYVSLEDIKLMAKPVLRHRIGLSFAAEKKGLSEDQVIEEIISEL